MEVVKSGCGWYEWWRVGFVEGVSCVGGSVSRWKGVVEVVVFVWDVVCGYVKVISM